MERNRIALTQLLSTPQKYVVPARLSSFDLDFRDIPPGSTFIYSFWSGYLEQPDWETLQERIKKAGARFVQCHTSGHIFPDDIKHFIETLQPKMLVPIHTTVASAFRELHPRTKLLDDGEVLSINMQRSRESSNTCV